MSIKRRLTRLQIMCHRDECAQDRDDITRAAVANFQTFINAQSGIPCPVQVTGIADPLTLEYLSLSEGKITNPNPGAAVTAQPTEAPAPTEVPEQPTEVPEQNISTTVAEPWSRMPTEA